MTAPRPTFAVRTGSPRRRHVGLAVMVVLAALWLGAASRIHVNASWSDGAWGYAAFPLFGEDPKVGDRVLFEPPEAVDSPVPYLKTVRGVPGMRIAVEIDRTVFLDGEPVGRAKAHALDGRPLEAIAPGIDPAGAFLPARRSPGQPRQPLRRDRPGAARANPGARRRPAGHSLARAEGAAGRTGGCRPIGGPAASRGHTAPGS